MKNLYKYPHTPYLHFSPTIESIDEYNRETKLIFNKDNFKNKTFVATTKLDGESCSMYRNYIHARSLDSRHHESRSYVKQLHNRVHFIIPEGWRICGENLYAVHSIKYTDLEDYFLVFSIWDENNNCLTWENTVMYSKRLGLKTVPVIRPFLNVEYDENNYFKIDDPDNLTVDKNLLASQEGFVIRNVESFNYNDFSNNLAKWVRPNHIQTDQHWMQKKVEKNLLRGKQNG